MTKIKIIPTFYSRDKKPTLRLLLTLTAVAAVIVALLIALGGEKYSAAVGITVAVYSLCAAVALFRAFRQQLQYSPSIRFFISDLRCLRYLFCPNLPSFPF